MRKRILSPSQEQYNECMNIIIEYQESGDGITESVLKRISDDPSVALIHLKTFVSIMSPKIKLVPKEFEGERFHVIQKIDQDEPK